MKVVPGDVVHVKGTVVHDYGVNGEVAVSFGGDLSVWIAESDIVHVERASLKVGDRVTWRGDKAEGTIIAIENAAAWIKNEVGLARGFGLIVLLNELERA